MAKIKVLHCIKVAVIAILKSPFKVKKKKIRYRSNKEITENIAETILFLAFLLVSSLVCLANRHQHIFYLGNAVHSLFLRQEYLITSNYKSIYRKILTMDDLWDYLQINFIDSLHGTDLCKDAYANNLTSSYAGPYIRPYPRRCYHTHNKTNLQDRVYLADNLLLGPPRVRQMRVCEDSCITKNQFMRYFNVCFGEYTWYSEQTYGTYKGSKYYTKSELDAGWIWTEVETYKGGGYVEYLTYERDRNIANLARLKAMDWIDSATRIVTIEWNMYNNITGIMIAVKLYFETILSGGVVISNDLNMVTQYSYFNVHSVYIIPLVIIFYIMLCYYMLVEAYSLKSFGLFGYFGKPMNILDFLIIAVPCTFLSYNIWHHLYVRDLVKHIQDTIEYVSLDNLYFWHRIYLGSNAVYVLLVYLKLFRYIAFNQTLIQFVMTIRRCALDLLSLMLIIFIAFLCYAMFGIMLFGRKHYYFHSFIQAMVNLLRLILIDFDYDSFQRVNRLVAPIYFLSFLLIVNFVLLNIFLVIMMSTYEEVKVMHGQNPPMLGTYIKTHCKRLFWTIFYFICRCCKPTDSDSSDKDSDGKHQKPYVEIVYNLKYLQEGEENEPDIDAHSYAAMVRDFSGPKSLLKSPTVLRNPELVRVMNRTAMLEEVVNQLTAQMEDILKRMIRNTPQ